ncbi:MAG: tetraacyldisaccharide 4'-kinase [Burkholderiaceae bacterium]|nr:tetraacyldisaccharide 4'-kinase [Burkholderiaceae bacterium]
MSPGRRVGPALTNTLLASWRKPRPDALARALQPLAWLYGALAAARRAFYAGGLRASQRAPRPLVVVGNLVAGGAGKTPTVIALATLLRRLGRTPGVVSRGYGRSGRGTQLLDRHSDAGAAGDEPLLIHLRARVPVAVAADRLHAARALCDAHPGLDVLIADDGLQHLALARDAQLIVFDERGAGNGLLLPAGPLREPLPHALPERTLVVYNADQPSTPLPGHVAHRALAGVVELSRWWSGDAADPRGWQSLRGRRIVACAGIAVPQRFFAMLVAQGLDIEPLPQPDHADYRMLPWPPSTREVIVTEKDAVKIRPERAGSTRIWVAPLDFGLDDTIGDRLVRWLPTPS